MMTTLDLITKDDLQHFKTELLTELKELLSGAPTIQPAKKWMRSADAKAIEHFFRNTSEPAHKWDLDFYQGRRNDVLQDPGY
jgi:hypothetical protein